MNKILIRHAETKANKGEQLSLTSAQIDLTDRGREQAKELRGILATLGIDVATTRAAVSELACAQITAGLAGFRNPRITPLLNEIPRTRSPHVILNEVEQGVIPSEAIRAAKEIMRDPPAEPVWITSGLIIAGLEYVLGSQGEYQQIPNLGEARELIL
jgi:broad specificity phosphatase PhoE